MKRSFVYLVLALMLSLLLSACGDMTDSGRVASSPWPDVTAPTMPVPSMQPSAVPTSDTGMANDNDMGTGLGNSYDSGTGGSTVTVTSSPAPTDTDR